MVRLYVKNWRCIEEIEVSLEPITIFIGKNSTGKSSLAYAPYFLTRVVEWKDANRVLTQLYGVQLDGVVRNSRGEKFYPLIVKAGESCLEARSSSDLSIPESRPWSDSYLLPSQRLSFAKISQFIPKLGREIVKQYPEARASLMFASGFFELLKTMPILPPMYFFFEDLVKLYLGKGLLERYELGDMGIVIEKISPLISLVEREYRDPFIELNLPMDLAPDGTIDSVIIKLFAEKAREDSLLVIEEPEIHKNPIQIIDLAKYLARKAVERRLTFIVTTHSDIVLQALTKAVEEGMVKPSHVAVYYLKRSHESPWTRAKRLEVYEDGTIEELPDVEKVVSALF